MFRGEIVDKRIASDSGKAFYLIHFYDNDQIWDTWTEPCNIICDKDATTGSAHVTNLSMSDSPQNQENSEKVRTSGLGNQISSPNQAELHVKVYGGEMLIDGSDLRNEQQKTEQHPDAVTNEPVRTSGSRSINQAELHVKVYGGDMLIDRPNSRNDQQRTGQNPDAATNEPLRGSGSGSRPSQAELYVEIYGGDLQIERFNSKNGQQRITRE